MATWDSIPSFHEASSHHFNDVFSAGRNVARLSLLLVPRNPVPLEPREKLLPSVALPWFSSLYADQITSPSHVPRMKGFETITLPSGLDHQHQIEDLVVPDISLGSRFNACRFLAVDLIPSYNSALLEPHGSLNKLFTWT